MFDDILGNCKKEEVVSILIEIDKDDYSYCPRCVKCDCVDYREIDRSVISQSHWMGTYKCNFCNERWYVTYDTNNTISKVEKERE